MPKLCSTPNCNTPVFSKGLCMYHWKRWKASQQSLTQTDNEPAKPFIASYRTKQIKKVSTRQQKLNAAYKVLRDQFMKKHPTCQARLAHCTGVSTECHHSRGRGEYLLDDSTFFALCGNCHRYLETHPEISKALGFTKSRLGV